MVGDHKTQFVENRLANDRARASRKVKERKPSLDPRKESRPRGQCGGRRAFKQTISWTRAREPSFQSVEAVCGLGGVDDLEAGVLVVASPFVDRVSAAGFSAGSVGETPERAREAMRVSASGISCSANPEMKPKIRMAA